MAKTKNILATILIIFLLVQFSPTVIKAAKNYYEDIFNLKTKVGLININDEITDACNYIKSVREFFKDDSIKAVLLCIESPGGTAGSGYALYNEIMSYKKECPKPLITLVTDICASSGYYVACASDHIICSPSAIVGSIGDYISVFKLKKLMEKYDVKYHIAQAGKYKDILNPYTDITPDMMEVLQTISDDSYQQFITDVAQRRKLSLSDSDKWANGKIFSGRRAFELGLIDEIGSEYNAIKKIREFALIEKDQKIDWIKSKSPSVFEKYLFPDDTVKCKSFMELFVNSLASKIVSMSYPMVK